MILRTGKTTNCYFDRGFTLIEMCLTGAIVASLFVVGWPAFSHVAEESRLESACKKFAYIFTYARDRALADGKCYRITFDVPSHTYRIAVEDDVVFHPGEFIPAVDMANIGNRWASELSVHEMSKSVVIFNPDGTTEDFFMSLANQRGRKYVLRLLGLTGRCMITAT